MLPDFTFSGPNEDGYWGLYRLNDGDPWIVARYRDGTPIGHEQPKEAEHTAARHLIGLIRKDSPHD